MTQWNQNAATALMGTSAQPPQQSVPHLAMVHGAVYDAVNAIDGGHEGYLLTSRVGSPFDSKDAAAATAAYRVLLSIVPARRSRSSTPSTPLSLAGDPRRRLEDAGHRGRRGGGGGDDRGADGRRPLRASRFPLGAPGPGVWRAGAAGVRQRPERVAART